MVKPNIQNKLSATNTHPPGPQAIPPSTGEPLDILNVISLTSSRAGKWIYPREHSHTHYTVRYSFRSVSAAENSKKVSLELSFTSEKKKSNKEEVSSSSRMFIVSKVTIDKLSHRVVPL